MMMEKKCSWLSILAAVALGLSVNAVAGPTKPKPTPKPPCPLSDNFNVAGQTVSPEKPLQAVCHNGKILCLPQAAAQAHIKHGDTPLGPCNKPGNLGPCP